VNDPAKLILKLMSLTVVLVWLCSVLVTVVFARQVGYWAIIAGVLSFGLAACCTMIVVKLWRLEP
jgi:hypothetical protein